MMAMTALFRGKWGLNKPQEVQTKPRTPVPHLPSEDDEDEDETLRPPIRRNSRFYRSMRKKRVPERPEQQESKTDLFTLSQHGENLTLTTLLHVFFYLFFELIWKPKLN